MANHISTFFVNVVSNTVNFTKRQLRFILEWILHEDVVVQYKLVESDAKSPTRAYKTDSGWDVYAYEDIIIKSKDINNVYVGVSICAPKNYGYTMRGRSSLNRVGVYTAFGTIDSFYSGKLFVLMYNFSTTDYLVKKGQKIAQIVFERVVPVNMVMVNDIVVPENARGGNGFGSSGK